MSAIGGKADIECPLSVSQPFGTSRRVPIVGRISMDLTVVNISGSDGVEPGDVATLIGESGTERITVDEVARLAGTISYEVLTGLAPRLPRIWLDDGGS